MINFYRYKPNKQSLYYSKYQWRNLQKYSYVIHPYDYSAKSSSISFSEIHANQWEGCDFRDKLYFSDFSFSYISVIH